MRKITIDMIKKILVDFYNSWESFDDYDVNEVSRKVDNGEDVPLEDFIKTWAYVYDFGRYFQKSESVENNVDYFIENNKFDYLEMLENEEYENFMDGILYGID